MSWQLNITRENRGGVAILRLDGRLGTSSSGGLIEAVATGIRSGDRKILLGMGGVDYASSAGLLALHAAAGRMHEAGGALVLCELAEPVRLVLDLAGLLPDFAVEPSLADGLARLQPVE